MPPFDEFRAGKFVFFFFSFGTTCNLRRLLTMFVGSTDITLGLSDKRVRAQRQPSHKTFDSSRDLPTKLLMLVLLLEEITITLDEHSTP